MKEKRFAVDIDGVLNNFHSYTRNIITRDYHITTPQHEYEVFRNCGFNEDDIAHFYKKYKDEMLEMPLTEGAAEGLYELKNLGVKIYICTARPKGPSLNETNAWFGMHGIPYEKLLFDCGLKVDTCQQHEIPIMVDDAPRNLHALNEGGIHTLRFDHPYNQEANGEHVHPVKNWAEIVSAVKEFYHI